MGQKKGQTGNPNGRPIGTPNKVTMDLRTWVKNIVENNMQQLENDLQELEPKERWNIIERLLNYAVPKMQSIEANIEAKVESPPHKITTEEQERFKRVLERPYNPHDFKNAGLDMNYNKGTSTPEEAAIFIKEMMKDCEGQINCLITS